ncbi:porin family protein [Lacinutrix jangbogonensis]|uniref:porin family protein n=1 Tax=Lacinutrix jangbogonensis TaxID=1469557 RepID=UPI00053D5D1F|nr:porin family protein [Lacinutrix jangbogonensis]
MKFIILFFCLCFANTYSYAQEALSETIQEVDALYKEDQFYFGLTYNLISKPPSGLVQSGFSGGFHFGYTKDMPINKRRNKAIGIGLGLSFNSFNQNIQISEDASGNTIFQIINENEITVTKNKFSTYMVEVPLEFRWRTSTAEEFKFWRIYTGFKLGYVFASNSIFEGTPQNIKIKNSKAINNLQYGLTLGAGYNTWNFYLYYALNPIFDDSAKIDGKIIEANAIKIGLMFYIL